jgi:hypothetical protein
MELMSLILLGMGEIKEHISTSIGSGRISHHLFCISLGFKDTWKW